MEDEKVNDSLANLNAGLVDHLILLFTYGLPVLEKIAMVVPSAGVIKSGIDLYNAIKATNFLNKLKAFLKESESVDEATKKLFQEKLGKDSDKFMLQVSSVIDRIESEEKSKILGKAFKYVLLGKVKKDDFLVISHIIDSTSLSDLLYFRKCYEMDNPIKALPWGKFDDKSSLKRLANSGLLNEKYAPDGKALRTPSLQKVSTVKATYTTSVLGMILIKVLRDKF